MLIVKNMWFSQTEAAPGAIANVSFCRLSDRGSLASPILGPLLSFLFSPPPFCLHPWQEVYT